MFIKKRPAYFCVKTRLNRYLAAFLAVVMTFALTACGNSGQNEKTKLTVYLYNERLLETYASTLQAMVPEAELEFVVGRNSADFYQFRQEHGELPDIITMGPDEVTRGMDSEISSYAELFDCQLLPYFCKDSNWILSTPRFHVALNGALDGEGNEQKKELALKVLAAMFSSEGYEAMLTDGYIYMLPYNRGVDVTLPESMSNLQSLIDANQLFILITSNTLNAAAMSAVQGMLLGELDAQSAYERMNELLIDPVVDQTVVATLDEGWPVSFQAKKGNQAASAMANTMRQLGGTELLLAPSSLAPGSLYAADYTELRLEESMKSGGIRIYSCTLTGAEVREFARLMVEGYDSANDPFSDQTLPVSSGFVMEVEKTAEGGYRLARITVDGAPLDDGAEYSFAVVDLPTQFQPLAELVLGEGAVERFAVSEDYARTMWVDYLKEGNQPVPPTEYIHLADAVNIEHKPGDTPCKSGGKMQ